jgi:hypothetical protein
MLAEQANGTLGSSAGSVGAIATQAVGAAENVGNTVVVDTESLASKAVEGLKSAATDLFKDMGWEHL